MPTVVSPLNIVVTRYITTFYTRNIHTTSQLIRVFRINLRAKGNMSQ